jgi:hypothetical protein
MDASSMAPVNSAIRVRSVFTIPLDAPARSDDSFVSNPFASS